MSEAEKKQYIDQLYEVLYHTESEEVYAVVGKVIDFVKWH